MATVGIRGNRSRRRKLTAWATGAVTALCTQSAYAQLVPQMARCAPYFGDHGGVDKSLLSDQKGDGIFNTSATRKLEVKFVYAKGAGDADTEASIQATSRVEICSVNEAGTLACPGWDGDDNWVIFDSDKNIGSKPGTNQVKAVLTDNATLGQVRTRKLDLDFDLFANAGKLLFLVVNATSKPTSLAGLKTQIEANGFCRMPQRMGEARDNGPATTSGPGQHLRPTCTSSSMERTSRR